jgi:hypothetical protein
MLVAIDVGPPPTLWDRILDALYDAWWGLLTAIAPTLPLLGAFIGLGIARALGAH